MNVDNNVMVCASAKVIAELEQAEQIARELSLAAKNARALVFRTGTQAGGFKVISNFFDELATETILAINKINVEAEKLTQVIVQRWRCQNFLIRLQQIELDEADGRNEQTIGRCVHNANDSMSGMSQTAMRMLGRIREQLKDIDNQMRGANVIAISSRIEAQTAGEHRQAIEEMANRIQDQAMRIKSQIQRASTNLSAFRDSHVS